MMDERLYNMYFLVLRVKAGNSLHCKHEVGPQNISSFDLFSDICTSYPAE